MSRKLKLRVTGAQGKTHRLRGVSVEIEVAEGAWLRISAEPGTSPTVLHLNAGGDAAALELVPLAARTLRLRTPLVPRHAGAGGEGGSTTVAGRETPAPVLSLSVQKALSDEEKRIAPRKHQLRRWASAALLAGHADVTIRLVGEAEGRKLNREYRDKDYATNVLSFVYDTPVLEEQAERMGWPVVVGDLVLCVPLLVREAVEQNKAIEAHFAHLVVHGMLHLQGYDHESDEAAARMESIEVGILAALGYQDPYA